MYPDKRLIHVFLDNARYHHAKLVQDWLAQPGCRIKLHFVPSYCPHLDPIERLWGLMHKNVINRRTDHFGCGLRTLSAICATGFMPAPRKATR